MHLSPEEMAVLQGELVTAEQMLASAREAGDPLQALSDLSAALDVLTATQHELVNALADRGTTWSTIADALSTTSAAAARRYPRRGGRGGPGGD